MKYILSLLFFSTSIVIETSTDENILIGVIEDAQYKKEISIARILYIKSNKGWEALDSKYDHEVLEQSVYSWILAFDGKNIGSVETIDDYETLNCDWCFPRDKVFRIINQSNIPKLGNKEKRFVDWTGLPKNRPVVIVNKPYYKDHEQWKRYNAVQLDLELLFDSLKDKIGKTYHCNGEPNWDATEIEITIKDVKLYRSYKNIKGQKLISAGLADMHTKDCDGPVDKTSLPIWFYIDNEIKFVGYELDLLDAADYDGDGEIEFIFHHSGYNEDGYTLFDSNFNERYDYYWNYH
ncbi:MAG: hypothetical protein OEY96_12995 [Gammaproteobacteria bacterium]|nr:hypothetical protein [Gammaproteobacteria bacterium]